MWDIIVYMVVLGIAVYAIYHYIIEGTIIEDGIKELWNAFRNRDKISNAKRSDTNRKSSRSKSDKVPLNSKAPNKKGKSDRSIPSKRSRKG